MRHWRWAVVIGGVLALTAVPVIAANRPATNPDITVEQLTARVVSSHSQPFEGLYRTRGGLRLPDLGRLDDEVAPFTSSSRVRVWYGAPDRWRADELLIGAERGVYRQPDGVWFWDSGTRRIVFAARSGDEPVRIPRLMDLSPAELGRRIVAESAGDEVVGIGARRVAGRVGAGLRITPSDPTTTISSVDLWADPVTGVVLEVHVNTGGTAPAFEAAFVDLTLTTPSADVMQFDPSGVDEPVRQTDSLDPIEQADQLSFIALPDMLAGMPRRNDPSSGLATYGSGLKLVNLVVAPTTALGRRIAALPETDRSWGGRASVLETSLINVEIVRVSGFAVVLSGTVTVAELDRIAGELIDSELLGIGG
jgi:hypothetical protein